MAYCSPLAPHLPPPPLHHMKWLSVPAYHWTFISFYYPTWKCLALCSFFCSVDVCVCACTHLTLCECLCVHMLNCQTPPTLWRPPPPCHATISLHCGWNLDSLSLCLSCSLSLNHSLSPFLSLSPALPLTHTNKHFPWAPVDSISLAHWFSDKLGPFPLKHTEWRKDNDIKKKHKHAQKIETSQSVMHHDHPTATSGVQTVSVWTKQTTYKHKASALRGSYLGPSVNSQAQNESIKRALCWFLFI